MFESIYSALRAPIKATMQQAFTSRPPNRQNSGGFSLIELLVSVAIGLLMAIAGSATYLYSKQNYNAVSETSQMEENGRFALNLLSRYVQSAGFVMLNPQATRLQGALVNKIQGCDFGMVNGQSPTSAADIACRAATPAGERRSASISTFSDTDAPNNTGARFQGFNCIGNNPVTVIQTSETGTPFTTYATRSHFFVSFTNVSTPNGTTTMGQLSCVADSSDAGVPSYETQPLIPGIEQIAVNYLLPSAITPMSAQAATTADALTTAARWGEVMAVELCVLTRSVQPAGNDTGTQYTDCYGAQIVSNAAQSFRTFRTVVNLRNRTPAL